MHLMIAELLLCSQKLSSQVCVWPIDSFYIDPITKQNGNVVSQLELETYASDDLGLKVSVSHYNTFHAVLIMVLSIHIVKCYAFN